MKKNKKSERNLKIRPIKNYRWDEHTPLFLLGEEYYAPIDIAIEMIKHSYAEKVDCDYDYGLLNSNSLEYLIGKKIVSVKNYRSHLCENDERLLNLYFIFNDLDKIKAVDLYPHCNGLVEDIYISRVKRLNVLVGEVVLGVFKSEIDRRVKFLYSDDGQKDTFITCRIGYIFKTAKGNCIVEILYEYYANTGKKRVSLDLCKPVSGHINYSVDAEDFGYTEKSYEKLVWLNLD